MIGCYCGVVLDFFVGWAYNMVPECCWGKELVVLHVVLCTVLHVLCVISIIKRSVVWTDFFQSRRVWMSLHCLLTSCASRRFDGTRSMPNVTLCPFCPLYASEQMSPGERMNHTHDSPLTKDGFKMALHIQGHYASMHGEWMSCITNQINSRLSVTKQHSCAIDPLRSFEKRIDWT